MSASEVHRKELLIDNQIYFVDIKRRVFKSPDCPRLLIVSYQPNLMAKQLLQSSLRVFQKFTPEPHEIWVIDNNSPKGNANWLLEWSGINVVLNRTEPIPNEDRHKLSILLSYLRGKPLQRSWGSYSNAIGLEIGKKIIDADSKYIMTLHMDTMPCKEQWLGFLISKIDLKTRAAGVRMDKSPRRSREGVLHVLGNLIDFQLFQELDLNFFPQLPRYDVGDLVTVRIRDAGYNIYACHNTLWEPDLINKISITSPLREFNVDRSFDDDWNVIFLHLGRGVQKATRSMPDKTCVEEWINIAEGHLLDNPK